jgi:predicted lipoprotein with Yx(FWY)xxD motif
MMSRGDLSLKRQGALGTVSDSSPFAARSFAMWRLVRLGGAVALVATGVIHLDLYLTGYRTIPTIGWLFLLQVIADFVISLALIVSSSRLVSAAGAGLVLSTLLGYLLALRISLFGFREVRTTAGIVAGVIEIVGFALLAAVTLRPIRRNEAPRLRFAPRLGFANRNLVLRASRWAAGILTVQAAISLGLLLPPTVMSSTNTGGSEVVVKVADVHGVPVLTTAHGYTLYWFAPDSPTMSRCYGTCAAYWPPLLGTATAVGISGSFATVKRSGGASQVTYKGHPLYTYVGDSAPGQASGNRVRLNGGLWYEMKVAG